VAVIPHLLSLKYNTKIKIKNSRNPFLWVGNNALFMGLEYQILKNLSSKLYWVSNYFFRGIFFPKGKILFFKRNIFYTNVIFSKMHLQEKKRNHKLIF